MRDPFGSYDQWKLASSHDDEEDCCERHGHLYDESDTCFECGAPRPTDNFLSPCLQAILDNTSSEDGAQLTGIIENDNSKRAG